jgi:hypothetical protein
VTARATHPFGVPFAPTHVNIVAPTERVEVIRRSRADVTFMLRPWRTGITRQQCTATISARTFDAGYRPLTDGAPT